MTTPDDGVREIQLSGKQLVFLFMAVTVVSVVIFLCGVLVGRGVQARTTAAEVAVAAEADSVSTAPPPELAADAPTPPAEVSFPERLEKNEPPRETLVPRREPPAQPAAPPARTATPAAAPTPPPAPKAAAPAPAADSRPTPGIPSEPRGAGFAIQVAALGARGEAEAIVRRLTGKGYAAYLVAPQAGQPPMFRVRVGKFSARAEAERVAARLEREERFKPWITR